MSWRERQKGISVNRAIAAVNKENALLVYPIKNQSLPKSLWSHFFPRSKMRWVWDENGDDRVVKIWDLRERLSRSERVVYTKWYQNRATFFSLEVFQALLSAFHQGDPSHAKISDNAQDLLGLLLDSSPQSTKSLRQFTKGSWEWDNRTHETTMKELWKKFLITGHGEVDDGAFPSLNVSATELRFEDLWKSAHHMTKEQSNAVIEEKLPLGNPFRKQWQRMLLAPKHRARKKTKSTLTYEEINSLK